jgi:hypothetical protein
VALCLHSMSIAFLRLILLRMVKKIFSEILLLQSKAYQFYSIVVNVDFKFNRCTDHNFGLLVPRILPNAKVLV